MKRILADWAPVIGAATALALFAAYYVLLDMRIGSLSEVRREQGKVLWGSSALVLTLAMFWCVTVSLITIYRHSSSFKRGHKLAVFISFGLLFLFLAPFVGNISGRAGNTLLDNIKKSGVPLVGRIIDFNNVFAILVVVLFVLALVFITRGVEKVGAELLSERIHWFNLLLYSGGVILAVTVYEVYSLFQWAASLEVDLLHRRELQHFASSLAIGAGLIFSSLLILIVVPSAIRLNRRLGVLMSEAVDSEVEFDPQKWLTKHRIEATPLRSLNSYIALLLPVATGLFTKVLGL